MEEILMGTIAFILFMIYDLEQAGVISHRFHRMTKFFFTFGFFLLSFATIALLRKEAVFSISWGLQQIFFLFLAVFSLLLLIYTLFFALPFEETYIAQDAHKTYDKRMYALCRHPGVLWFTGFYFSVWLAFGTMPLLWMAAWYSFLNLCYIILQDFYTFPRIFSDYRNYKKRVPFLIPNGKSLKRCFETFKESR